MRVAVAVILALFLIALAAIAWAVVLPSPTQAGPLLDHSRLRPQGGRYVSAFPEPKHLNPFTTTDYVTSGQVLRYTHDTLMQLDAETGEPSDGVAELVETSPDHWKIARGSSGLGGPAAKPRPGH